MKKFKRATTTFTHTLYTHAHTGSLSKYKNHLENPVLPPFWTNIMNPHLFFGGLLFQNLVASEMNILTLVYLKINFPAELTLKSNNLPPKIATPSESNGRPVSPTEMASVFAWSSLVRPKVCVFSYSSDPPYNVFCILSLDVLTGTPDKIISKLWAVLQVFLWRFFMLLRCFLNFSVGVGAFVIGISQISSFFSFAAISMIVVQ